MQSGGDTSVTRILIVDDNRAIHDDLRKVLVGDALGGELLHAAAALFGDEPLAASSRKYAIDSAYQGIDALEMLRAALADERPYAMAFVDMRMPPGWDGVETIERLWKEDPHLQVCICTAFSDYSWAEISDRLDSGDSWLILKKPFDNIEVQQVATSLTEKRRLMSIAAMRLQDLERLVEERTVELHESHARLREEMAERLAAEGLLREREEQLAHAQKLEALGTIAGGVAHEFNNLLQVIVGYGQCALENLTNVEAAQNDVEQVLKAAHRAGVLTSQLLGFSRQQPLEVEAVDINQLVAEFLDLARPLFGERISIHVALDPAAQTVQVDANQIRQVLLNLALNARDAMPDEGRLSITTRCAGITPELTPPGSGLAPGDYIEIALADSGVGIPPAVRDRVFEPFFTTKEVGRGSGLGLSMVHGIVRQHGGDITFTSEEGRGTTFRILLPVAASALEAARSLNPLDSLAESINADRRRNGATILVAEDDPQVRSVLARTLSHAGYRVVEAEHGLHALEQFDRSGDVELALLDVVMPKLGGWELFKRLRSRRPSLRAIFCTGYDPNGANVEKLAAGDVPVLHKPVTRAALLGEVQKALSAQIRGPRDQVEPAMSGVD